MYIKFQEKLGHLGSLVLGPWSTFYTYPTVVSIVAWPDNKSLTDILIHAPTETFLEYSVSERLVLVGCCTVAQYPSALLNLFHAV